MSDIPDAISPDALAQLLTEQNQLPPSANLPVIDFGGEHGGVCDLQLAITQLISRGDGLNHLQILVSALHLFHWTETALKMALEQFEASEPPFDEVPPMAKAAMQRQIITDQQIAMTISELGGELLQRMSMAAVMRRTKELCASHGEHAPTKDITSQVLVSEPVLQALELRREDVTDFLERQAATL